MADPYDAPLTKPSAPAPADSTPTQRRLRLVAMVACALAVVVFAIVAGMLIPQSLSLQSQDAGLPPRLQNGNQTMVRASWIGGWVAIMGIVVNVAGLLLARQGKALLSLALCAITVLCMVAIAIMFKPV